MEQKCFSQNQPDTCLLVKSLCENMIESRTLRTLQLVGMKFSKEAYTVMGAGIAKARALKKLIINQTNIATYGLQEMANGFAISSSIEYLDLQQNDLNDSHSWTLAKIIST